MPHRRNRALRLLLASALAGALLLPGAAAAVATAAVATAAEPLTVDARAMLAGHTRVGTWMAIDVRIRNDGPALVGELRLSGGAQGRTRFSTAVDVPTTSDKRYRLYAQPPAFGTQLDVTFVAGGRTVATAPVAFTVHEPAQLVVGIVAEDPQRLGGSVEPAGGASGPAPAVVPLAPADLPDRVEGWAALDRLVWQDVDSTQLSAEQVAALRGWIAAGGRLVLVGGTANPSVLSAFPDDVLPFRPDATIEVPAASVATLLGGLPAAATDLAGLAGSPGRGRVLASVGDRVVAAEATYGAGGTSILGIDPATGWIADSASARATLWGRMLPPRVTNLVAAGNDDSHLVNAASQLPSLALPPIGGLLALLAGYIVLIGPANYLVLRRLDRREWAWVTMPVLIAVFAVGSYGFGLSLRGLDVVVNEVAIVRGAPGAQEGTAQVYFGVLSPTRGTYDIEVPGGALLASTVTGELVTGDGGGLDIVQGDPSEVRQLSLGTLRTLRAESTATLPEIEISLHLSGETLSGSVRNRSNQTLEDAAVVLGSSVALLDDLDPGEERDVSLRIEPALFEAILSDRILGPLFFGDPTRSGATTRRDTARHYVIDHLTFDPTFRSAGRLPSETPVFLAWGSGEILDVVIDGQAPRRAGNVLYYIPTAMQVGGPVAFGSDLIRTSVVEIDALNFNMDQYAISVGAGSATLAYRPIVFDGELAATRLLLSMGFGGEPGIGSEPPRPMAPSDRPAPIVCDPAAEECVRGEALPSVEIFDRTAGGWRNLPAFSVGHVYDLADPERYVDRGNGAVLVRFASDNQGGAYFSFHVRIEGDVR